MPVWKLSNAHPVWIGGQVAGALLLEDSTVARLSLAQQSLERFTLLVAAALAATALALMAVASLAVSRIVRLRRAAEGSIDTHGRVRGVVPRFRLRDEVDAMAASYNRLLGRLHEHQDYLAKLRSRLVHELRTPIMVVRSSLDNLAAEADPQRTAAYAQRAQAGAARLERIVASMGEASSLEAMLEDSEMESIDLVELVGACLDGYRTAYPGARLRLAVAVAAAPCEVAPEAIAQALDKLVGNAVDFATPGSEIGVGVGAVRANGVRCWRVSVTNQGPALPDAMADSVFESMVSVRGDASGAPDARGHLGLGLYLVRLIAEFHGGGAEARNVTGGVEVAFTVRAAG
jgi:two-component system, OmpR family, sensor histidine kinase ChvG